MPTRAAPEAVAVRLGGGRSLSAVFQGVAKLPFGGTEVGAGHRQNGINHPVVPQQRRQRQGFGHGGAGAVQPEKGDHQFLYPVGGADALVEQISRQQQFYLPRGDTGFLQGQLAGPLLKPAFRLFPGFFSEGGVVLNFVEPLCHGALPFLFAAYRGAGQDGGGMVHGKGASAKGDGHRRFSFRRELGWVELLSNRPAP